ncbi:MAG: ABC transporter permease [bacterium]|nr:ABC transporter permease [Acidimicrobiia bacterium]MCY4651307.1 ABC transporter permease [bacterium]
MSSSQPGGITRRFLPHSRLGAPALLIAGFLGLAVVIVLTVWGQSIAGFDPGKQNLTDRLLPPGADGHLLGTDKLGKDIFARVAAGFRWSIPVALLATAISASIGTTIGVIAGWNEGWIRSSLSRFMEVAISFPYLVLAVAIIGVVGRGFFALSLSLGLVAWVSFARVIYAETRRVKEREYVMAARLMGMGALRIILTYIGRGIRPTLVVMCAFIFADLLVAEAGLSFLGLGASLRDPTWGNMLSDSRINLFEAPWMMYGPASAVILTVLTANMIGDGLLQYWGRGTHQQ